MRTALGALLLASAIALAADQRVVIGAFSAGDLAGWEDKRFLGETRYTIVEDGARCVLKAESRAVASGLYRRVQVDLEQTPYLHWSWKVRNTLGDIDETAKAGDDYAARVYVVFSGGLAFWRTHAVNYVWASRQPQGAAWPNAFTANARMIAMRSGEALIGQWVHERRNVREDYRRLFGRDVRYVDAVAVMTDTDNTGKSAIAWYGDIYFAAD